MFFHSDYTLGLSAVFLPYNGYLHLVPRLIAIAASFFDPLWIPGCYVYASLLLTLYVAARTQTRRMPFKTHAGFALAVALVPDAPDGLLNPTNLQFILACSLILLLISIDPATPRELVHDVVALLLLGLTGPFSVVLAPLFLLRALLRRSRTSWILASIGIVTGLIQVWMIIRHPLQLPPAPDERMDLSYLFAVPGSRLAGSLLLGHFFPARPSLLALNLAGIATLALIGYLACRHERYRWPRLMIGACCVLLLASALFRQRMTLPSMAGFGFGSRYFYGPQLLVLWLLMLSHFDSRVKSRVLHGALLVFLAVNLPRLREPAMIDFHWASYAPKIRNGEAVDIPINPDWTIPLPARKPSSNRTGK